MLITFYLKFADKKNLLKLDSDSKMEKKNSVKFVRIKSYRIETTHILFTEAELIIFIIFIGLCISGLPIFLGFIYFAVCSAKFPVLSVSAKEVTNR